MTGSTAIRNPDPINDVCFWIRVRAAARAGMTKVIRCDEVQWRFLGLSLAGYNLLISLLMAAIAGWGFFRLQRR